MPTRRLLYRLLVAAVGFLAMSEGLPLTGAGAAGVPGAFQLHLLAPLPAGLRPLANGPVVGSAFVDGRLWIGFESLSARPTRGSCIAVTACSSPLPPPTHGLVAILSAKTGRLLATMSTGTNPRLAAADGHIWIGTMRSLPYDGTISPQMPRVPAVGGGWVREYDGRSGRLLHTYKVPFPTDITATGNRAYVFSLIPKHPYEGGDILELEGGRTRTVTGLIKGITYGPMAICDDRIAISTTIPGRATPSSSDGSIRADLTVVSLQSGRRRSEPIPKTASWTTCAGNKMVLVPFFRNKRVMVYNDAWPPRVVSSLPAGETSTVAVSSGRSLWLTLSKGPSLTSPYVVERYASGHWSEVPVHPPLGHLQADTWSLAAGPHKLLFLGDGNVYSLTGTALEGRGVT